VTGTGIPLELFDDKYHPSVNVHEALKIGMGDQWTFSTILFEMIKEHIEYSNEIVELKEKYQLSGDECASISYYTCDVRNQKCPVTKQRGKIGDCPFKRINMLLVSRDLDNLEIWKPFLFYLLSGLNKLPMKKERVYRALDKPITSLSKQYKKDSKLCWIGFTSTSLNREIMNSFVDKQNNQIKNGTYLMIDAIEGKDISLFSLYPEESEVILLPNSFFIVDDLMPDHFKTIMGLPSSVDAIVLTQQPTPPRLRLMKQTIHEDSPDKHQLEQLKKLINELQESLKNKTLEFEKEKKGLQSKIIQLEQEKKELNAKIKELGSSNNQSDQEKKGLQSKIIQLEQEKNSKIIQLDQENTKLKAKIKELESKQESQPLKKQEKESKTQVIKWSTPNFKCDYCGKTMDFIRYGRYYGGYYGVYFDIGEEIQTACCKKGKIKFIK